MVGNGNFVDVARQELDICAVELNGGALCEDLGVLAFKDLCVPFFIFAKRLVAAAGSVIRLHASYPSRLSVFVIRANTCGDIEQAGVMGGGFHAQGLRMVVMIGLEPMEA